MRRLLLILAAWLALAGVAGAQAAHDTFATGTYASGTSFSWSHTIASGGKVLMFCGWKFAALESITGITVGGSAASFVSEAHNGSGGNRIELWKHESPSSGAQTIQVTFDGDLGADGGSAQCVSVSTTSLTGFAAGTAAGPVSTATPSITIGSVGANDMPYAGILVDLDPTQQDTAVTEVSGGGGNFINVQRQSAGGDGVLNWTIGIADESLMVGTRAIGSGGGGGGATPASRLLPLGVGP